MPIRRLAPLLIVLLALACSALTCPVGQRAPTPAPSPEPSATSPAPTAAPTRPPTETATPEPVAAAYIPPGCEHIPPATVPPATTVAQPTPFAADNPPISAEQQRRVFEQVVSRIEKVYVYPDYNGQDWPAIVARYRAEVEAGLDTEAFYARMRALVTELGDEHSHFESPAQVAESNAELSGANDYVGIGILVLPMVDKGRVAILSVFPDSSAEHGGLQMHDSILAVDGLPIVEDGTAYPHRVRGPECSAVVLTVQSPGGLPREVTFIRYHITSPLPIVARLVETADGSRIGYIFLPTFFDRTIPDQVEKALADFGPLDGLILDGRMNGGGSSDVLEATLAFVTSGTLGHFRSRADARPLAIRPNPIHNSQTVPLVVLVSEETASFGEVFAGVLKDSGRAQIVGQTSLGNVEILHGYSFEDGSRLWIAEEAFDPAVSHSNWEETGIVPDVEAIADWDTFTFETDPSVAAAVALLGRE